MNITTVSESTLLSTYHSVLIDVILILVFMLGFKFGTAYLMVIMTKWFEDEPDSVRKKKPEQSQENHLQVPKYRKVGWLGFAALWILNGVIQFRPLMVIQSSGVLFQHSKQVGPAWLLPLMHQSDVFFAQTPIWTNIGSAVIQLLIGIFMLVWPEKLLGKIAIVLSLAFSLVTWVLWEGLGHLFHSGGTYFLGGPGAGILYFLAGLMLMAPMSWWENKSASRVIRLGFTLFWLLCALWNAIPGNGFWSSSGIQAAYHQTIFAPAGLEALHNSIMALYSSSPMLWNLIMVAVFLVLAVGTWFGFSSILFLTISLIWFAFTWLFGQSLGMTGGFGLPVNSAPVLALLYLAGWWGARETQSLPSAEKTPSLNSGNARTTVDQRS